MLIIFVPIFIISSEKNLYRLGSKIWSVVVMKDHIHHILPFIV